MLIKSCVSLQSVNSSENVTESPMQATVFSLQNALNNVSFQSRFLSGGRWGGGYQKELDIYFVETNTYQIMSSIFSLFLFVLSHTHREERALESICFLFCRDTKTLINSHHVFFLLPSLSHREKGGVLLNTVEDETHSQMPDEMMKSFNFGAAYICCNISFNFCK